MAILQNQGSMFRSLFILLLLYSFINSLISLSELDISEDVVITSATRTVDLTSQIVRVKTEYQIANRGNSAISYFVHAISPDESKRLSWMVATESAKESSKLRIARIAIKRAPNDYVFHKVELLKLLDPKESISITVEYFVTEYLVPHPKEIEQSDNQYVLYNGFANVLSPFAVEDETITFKTGTKPISFTGVSPTKYSAGQVVYGPYRNSSKLSQSPIQIHFENNAPFVVATSVERIIEVSHWGNIAVEEHIEIVNKGALLKGSFSRLDFQMDRRGGQPIVKSIRTNLPFESQDIYYRDEIGNISTSTISPRNNRLEVELRPRFPLFGGWKTNYVIGYNLPTNGYLFSKGSDYALKFRILGHLYDNAVVENLKLKIILPEMSKNMKLVTPYSVKRLPDEICKTYLDTFGRPVIVLEKNNLVNNHIQSLTIYYQFEKIYLLREPLLLVGAFSALFIFIILLTLLDFSIGKTNPKDKEKEESHKKKE